MLRFLAGTEPEVIFVNIVFSLHELSEFTTICSNQWAEYTGSVLVTSFVYCVFN